MNTFIFNYRTDLSDSHTVIFTTTKLLSEQDLTAEIKQFHATEQRSNKIVYIYPHDNFDSQIILILISAANVLEEDIILIPYDKSGVLVESELAKEVFYYGNLAIIRKNNIILHSDSNFHYINPSFKHSPYFIRTANMLMRNEEINFIALQLLKYTSKDFLTEIVCDTSSILALPYAVLYMHSIFGIHLEIPIRSFGSYAHKEYQFKRSSLIIISASNSGRLEDEIRTTEHDIDIVTLIYNSKNTTGDGGVIERDVLLNIDSVFHDLIPNDHSRKQFNDPEECDYCNNNSIPVMVRDDQFMPSRVLTQKIIIKKHHHDPNLIKAIQDFTCNDSIFTFKGENVSAKVRDIFFDVQALMEKSEKFSNSCKKLIKNSIPASCDLIIYLEDKSSRFLANNIFEYLKNRLNGAIPEIRSFKEIDHLQDIEKYSTIVIISSCISTGNILNAIAQGLRRFKKSSLHYIIGIARLSDADKLKLLNSNLESRQGNDEVNKLHVVYECFLPNNHSRHATSFLQPSWFREQVMLKEWLDRFPAYSEIIANRLKEIDKLAGMCNNLFYKDPFTGNGLALRPNFVYFNFDGKQPSQADVYFIMYSVIHCLRNPKILVRRKSDDKFLLQHEHVKSLIAPDNFIRFNDGVIQASILRIARPAELDYSVDEEHSAEMLRIMKIIFIKDNLSSSEAIVEFLFALAHCKLKLRHQHTVEFIEHLKVQFSGYSHVDFFIAVIQAEVLK